ncbi:hypothetical protein [Prosthecobacter sp.]|uniref:hypothetical protein n=1 Tax=Prosthecobacter sp. TaxID=1965333 RepID=UPI0037834C99
MSAYLITREGQELGTYTTSQIEKGLETGFFRVSDLAWCEADGWKVLTEIVGSAPAPDSVQSPAPVQVPPASAPAIGESETAKPLALNPIAATMAQARAAAGAMVTPAVLSELSHTWPWLRFISSLMAIGCLLMILASLGLAVNGEGPWTGLHLQHLGRDARSLLLAAGSTLLTFLILYPALKMSNYAANIARLAQTQSPADLAAALAEQRRFWRFYGILTLLHLCAALALLFGCLFATRFRFSAPPGDQKNLDTQAGQALKAGHL